MRSIRRRPYSTLDAMRGQVKSGWRTSAKSSTRRSKRWPYRECTPARVHAWRTRGQRERHESSKTYVSFRSRTVPRRLLFTANPAGELTTPQQLGNAPSDRPERPQHPQDVIHRRRPCRKQRAPPMRLPGATLVMQVLNSAWRCASRKRRANNESAPPCPPCAAKPGGRGI